jgi:hypothetical protein
MGLDYTLGSWILPYRLVLLRELDFKMLGRHLKSNFQISFNPAFTLGSWILS